jgi:hypothetical protein
MSSAVMRDGWFSRPFLRLDRRPTASMRLGPAPGRSGLLKEGSRSRLRWRSGAGVVGRERSRWLSVLQWLVLRRASGARCPRRLADVGRGWPPRLACLGLLLLLLAAAPAQAADPAPAAEHFRCDGVALTATLHGGAVDDPAIPNRSGGTLPGAFVQLQWQRAGEPIALQLPRTNNAGAPSFTDGKWWWSLEDPSHPRFRLRRGGGDIEDFACERA